MLLQLGVEADEHICIVEGCTIDFRLSDGVTARDYWILCFEIPRSTTTIVNYLYRSDYLTRICICTCIPSCLLMLTDVAEGIHVFCGLVTWQAWPHARENGELRQAYGINPSVQT